MNFEREIKILQLQVSEILRKIKAKSTSWGELLGDIRNQIGGCYRDNLGNLKVVI